MKELRSGACLEFAMHLSGPCPFRAGLFLGQAAVAKAAFYAALGSASMGNREGPARTARRRVDDPAKLGAPTKRVESSRHTTSSHPLNLNLSQGHTDPALIHDRLHHHQRPQMDAEYPSNNGQRFIGFQVHDDRLLVRASIAGPYAGWLA